MGVLRVRETWVVLLLATLTWVGCSRNTLSERYSAERAFARAEILRKSILINPYVASSELYQKAVYAYRSLTEKFGDKAAADAGIERLVKASWQRMAELYLMQDDLTSAIETYQRMTQLFVDDSAYVTNAYLTMGICYERSFDLPEAINAYEKVVAFSLTRMDTASINLTLLQVPLRLARLKHQAEGGRSTDGFYDSAVTYYEKLASRWPDSPTAVYAMEHLAAAYADQSEWKRSVQVLQKIAARHPASEQAPQVLLAMGDIYVNALDQPLRGLRIFERIQRNYPDFAGLGRVRLAVANTQLSMGRTEKALSMFREIGKDYSDDVLIAAAAQRGIAQTYEVRREWQKALSEYHWLADSYPLTPDGLYAPLYIARWYDRRGRTRLAKAEYQAAVQRYSALAQKYPRSRLALLAQQYLSVAYARLEKWRSALGILEAIRRGNSQSPAAIASYLMSASIYEQLGDYKRAAETYSIVLQRFPRHPVVKQIQAKLTELARRQGKQGKRETPAPVRLHEVQNLQGPAIRLTWSEDPGYDFREYRLYRSTRPGVDTSAVQIALVRDASGVVFVDKTVTAGLRYYYRVFTINSKGSIAGSNEVSGVAIRNTPPKPVSLRVASVDVSGVELEWSPSRETDFDHYRLLRSSQPNVSMDSEMIRFYVDPDADHFLDTRVQPNQTYYYRIYVFDKGGQPAASNEVSATIPANRAPDPVKLTAEYRPQEDAITLSWASSDETDFAMYRLYRSADSTVSTSGVPLSIVSDRLQTRFEDRRVRPGVTYWYRLLVVDKGGLVAESNKVKIRASAEQKD